MPKDYHFFIKVISRSALIHVSSSSGDLSLGHSLKFPTDGGHFMQSTTKTECITRDSPEDRAGEGEHLSDRSQSVEEE